jgi:hypothetical protein
VIATTARAHRLDRFGSSATKLEHKCARKLQMMYLDVPGAIDPG